MVPLYLEGEDGTNEMKEKDKFNENELVKQDLNINPHISSIENSVSSSFLVTIIEIKYVDDIEVNDTDLVNRSK